MREFTFLFLYGAVTLAAMFLAGFWGRFAYRRGKQLYRGAIRDRYFVLATGIALNSFGLALLCGARTAANLHYGLSRALYGLEGAGVLLGLTTVLMSKVMLVWLADLEHEPPRWTWLRWMAIVTAAWAILMAFMVDGVPRQDFRPITQELNNG